MNQNYKTEDTVGNVIITADNQIGKQQYQKEEREQDSLNIWRYICNKSKTIIVAGDFFDRPILNAPEFHNPMDIAFEATKQGTKIFGIPGNHDASQRDWFDWEQCPIQDMDDKKVTWNGCKIHFLGYRQKDELLTKLKEIAEKGKPDVIIGHQMFCELAPLQLGQISAKDIIRLGLNNITFFFGDIHTSCDWQDPVNKIDVIYPGSPNMTAKNEGEHKSHKQGNWTDTSLYAIEWLPTPGWPQQWNRIKLPTRPWFRYKIETQKQGWEQQLNDIEAICVNATEKDEQKRKPLLHINIKTPTIAHLKNTQWPDFILRMRKKVLDIQWQIHETQDKETTTGTGEEEEQAPKTLLPDEAQNTILRLLERACRTLPEKQIIVELAELSLRPDKKDLTARIDQEINPETNGRQASNPTGKQGSLF